jgi:hypothetical protein
MSEWRADLVLITDIARIISGCLPDPDTRR